MGQLQEDPLIPDMLRQYLGLICFISPEKAYCQGHLNSVHFFQVAYANEPSNFTEIGNRMRFYNISTIFFLGKIIYQLLNIIF